MCVLPLSGTKGQIHSPPWQQAPIGWEGLAQFQLTLFSHCQKTNTHSTRTDPLPCPLSPTHIIVSATEEAVVEELRNRHKGLKSHGKHALSLWKKRFISRHTQQKTDKKGHFKGFSLTRDLISKFWTWSWFHCSEIRPDSVAHLNLVRH